MNRTTFCLARLVGAWMGAMCILLSARAETIYSDNLTHSFSTSGLTGLHATNGTTFNVLPGAGINISYADSAGLNFDNTSHGSISGGTINGGSAGLQAMLSSTVSVSGGSFSSHSKGLYEADNATVNLSGGTFFADGIGLGIRLEGHSTANVNGGSYEGSWNGVEMVGNSNVNIRGGIIRGDTFHGITVRENSVANVYEGNILGIANDLDVRDAGMIYVYGRDFNLPFGLIGTTTGTLTGHFSDGTPLSLRYEQGFANGQSQHIMLVHATPEPSTGVLALIAGGLACWWRKRATLIARTA